MDIRFDGKVALITGAGKGIGRESALTLAASGAKIVVADVDAETSAETVKQVQALGSRAIFAPTDVRDPAACERAVQTGVEAFGRLDIQVNNAGISAPFPSLDMPPEHWSRIIDINLSGVFFSSQAAARQMVRQENGGVIISMASISAAQGFPKRAPYCAAKAGVVALTQVLAAEWAAYNIRVNAVAPGYVMTDIVTTNIAAGNIDLPSLQRRTPMNRLATPQDIANAVALLASDYAGYITGETLYVDGGWTAYAGLVKSDG